MKLLSGLITILIFACGFTFFIIPLPTETSETFSGSGNCEVCHASNGIIMMAGERDISPVNMWRSTMMANSSKDPLWRAVVSEESDHFPHAAELIESTCARCHAPMGWYQSDKNGEEHFTLSQIKESHMALDGVSCTLCHQIKSDNFGQAESYTGSYIIGENKEIFGPYENPLTQQMQGSTNYTPVHSEHVSESALCATCHTLITPYFDDAGEIAGTYTEQAPYLEWMYSSHAREDRSCQTCHMKAADEGQIIASRPGWLDTKRSPFFKHEFVGGNSWMLNILKANADELELGSDTSQFNSTLDLVNENFSLSENISQTHEINNGTLLLNINIKNLTGHKLPTGIPLRRMWLHVKVKDGQQNILFESGDYNDDGELFSGEKFHPHYQEISSPDEIQIYEAVPVDVNGEMTYTLLRAARNSKDNRLLPDMFILPDGSSIDQFVNGEASDDPDYLKNENQTSYGEDNIMYRIPIGNSEKIDVEIELLYQTVKPAWIDHLRHIETDDAKKFIELRDDADNSPILMSKLAFSESINGIDDIDHEDFYLYPNPATDFINIGNCDLKGYYQIMDNSGRIILQGYGYGNKINISVLASGAYYFIYSSNGNPLKLKFIKE